MSYSERYAGKRRVIRRALKLMDRIKKMEKEQDALKNEIDVLKGRMTGGDRAAYDLVVIDERK